MLGVLLRTYKNCIVITVAIKIIKLHHADIHVLIQKYHAIKKPAQGGLFCQTILRQSNFSNYACSMSFMVNLIRPRLSTSATCTLIS